MSQRLEPVLLAVAAAALIAGGISWLMDVGDLAGLCWEVGTLFALVPAVGWVLAALRQGRAVWTSSSASRSAALWPCASTLPVP
ncbi:hypothetical protein [Streptomyces barringtoniae]|uniref:hypothetical protein n=1 Tax=Streptomyces barringtoniae TaxID=2892029 RepID=UPI001E5BF006|nr:hypothetical protein [Streptomyces barringtoniae]MCC5478333.1 hypothetical protein [Streptomyces barringtoniae]